MLILPCPFCKSDNVAVLVQYGHYSVFCSGCYMRGPACRTEKIAIERYNLVPRIIRDVEAAVHALVAKAS